MIIAFSCLFCDLVGVKFRRSELGLILIIYLEFLIFIKITVFIYTNVLVQTYANKKERYSRYPLLCKCKQQRHCLKDFTPPNCVT